MSSELDIPEWFHDQIRQILREWHTGSASISPLRESVLFQHVLVAHTKTSPNETWQVVRSVVHDWMGRLRQQGLADAIDLLQQRFIEKQTAQRVGYKLGLSENLVYQRQRRAISLLVGALWAQELALRQERAKRSLHRLPATEVDRLFGVSESLTRARSFLARYGEPRVLCIEGIGGIGKTTLAVALAHDFVGTPRYEEILWVSARQEDFTAWNGVTNSGTPALTLPGLLAELIDQLELDALRHRPLEDLVAGMRDTLRNRRCLVIVDNLETAVDYESLVPKLHAIIDGDSKCLITSRYSLRDYPGVRTISLSELSLDDALALLRHEAQNRGLDDLATALDDTLSPIYDVVGGNPLALRLTMGLAHLLPLPTVLQALQEARGKKAEDLYHYVYRNAWEQLDDDAQDVLVRMPVFSHEGATLEQLQAVNDLPTGRLLNALTLLTNLSLVNVGGDLRARRYSIHRLTESFLLHEVLRWQEPNPPPP